MGLYPGHVFFSVHLVEVCHATLPGVQQHPQLHLASNRARIVERGHRPPLDHNTMSLCDGLIKVFVHHPNYLTLQDHTWGVIQQLGWELREKRT